MASGPTLPANQNPFGAADEPQRPQPKSNTVFLVLVIVGVVGVGMLMCAGVLVALLLPAVSAARNAARQMSRNNNVKMVALGLQNYHDVYNQLPPTISEKSTGEQVFGWRLSISPFVVGKSQWDAFDQERSWDSDANRSLIQHPPPSFQSLEGDQGQTNIFAVISDDGLFLTTPNEGMKYRDVIDGLANTLLAVELPNRSAEWSSTENLTPDQAYTAITSLEPQQVAFLLMADTTVLVVRNDLDRAIFDAMVTRAGGEVVALPGRQW